MLLLPYGTNTISFFFISSPGHNLKKKTPYKSFSAMNMLASCMLEGDIDVDIVLYNIYV